MKHYDFFQNSECEYFPCHKGADPKTFSCLFCYCPLYALAEHYGLTTQGAHRALNDCRMNQQVFERLAREPRREAKRCPRCGQPLALRKGRFGAFYGCTGYPVCRYTENVK